MPVWVVRGGRRGEFEETFLSEGLVGIHFGLQQSVLDFENRESLREFLVPRGRSAADQLWRFSTEIEIDDTIVLPRKWPIVIAVGRMTGIYEYRPNLDAPHVRSVNWEAIDIPRSNFDQDLLFSIGGTMTVFRVLASDAQSRIDTIKSDYLAGLPSSETGTVAITIPEEEFKVDIEEQINDRVIDRIRQKFSGTRLEYLVAEVLKASGYRTLQTRQGPDGGIDVVAGPGDLGFGHPRLCVQVKSGKSPVDLPEYDRLRGNINSFGADHGLLVSLSEFTGKVRNENERSFFQIRLWGPYELVDKVLETYDDLPEDIREDIPLRSRRILIETE